MFDFTTLITDRSQEDVDTLIALLSKPLEQWTEEELTAFNGGAMKGGYWWTDLNRVTACMEYLDAEFREMGYKSGYKPIVVHEAPPPMYDENTLFLLHGNSFIDSSVYNNPVHNTGATIANFGKFNKSISFTSAVESFYITLPKNLTQSDFTIDWWEYRNANDPSNSAICMLGNKDQYGTLISYRYSQDPDMYFYSSSNGYSWDIASNIKMGDLLDEQWVHRAVVRNGSSVLLFQNGTLISTVSNIQSLYMPTNILTFSRVWKDGYLDGYVEEFRVSDVARWTENFDPPTEPYKADFVEEPKDQYTWYKEDNPTLPQINQYLSNVDSLRSTLAEIPGNPVVPKIVAPPNGLTAEKANAIETVLTTLQTMLENMKRTINLGWALGIADIGLYGGV